MTHSQLHYTDIFDHFQIYQFESYNSDTIVVRTSILIPVPELSQEGDYELKIVIYLSASSFTIYQ